jgi:hypothetical protein
MSMRTSAVGIVSGGQVNLSRYSTLTYAPNQWGPGIRIASTGKAVDEIAAAVAVTDLAVALDAMAEHCGITVAELCDAIRFDRDRRVNEAE